MLLKLQQFLKDPSATGINLFSTHANKQYQDANDTLVELLLKRDSLLKDYTAKHPEVIEIERKTIETARKMVMIIQLQIKSLTNRKVDLNKELDVVDKKTSALMEKKLEYNRLKRKVDSYNDMTALLEQKNQEASIRKAEKPEEVTLVRPAFLPTSPINPPKTVATGVMGVLIGLILGIIIAFIVETFDTSLGAIADVEETLGTQVLGVIPHGDMKSILESVKDTGSKGAQSDFFKTNMPLVSHFAPRSILAESFRGLRTNIQFRAMDKKIKTVTITSASPQEGKTTITINLAITMAQAGMKTLLVGSDLRKPMLAKAFGIETSPGLTDVLIGNYAWSDVVKTITDIIIGRMDFDAVMMTPGLDNLHIITSGTIPPNPAELIDSKRLDGFIEDVKNDYDIIIFDSPPILSTTDPLILGAKVDAVVFVYRIGSVSRGLLKRSTLQLSQVKDNLMGVALNGIKAEVSPDFQDFKYYKSYYSYENKETKKDKKPRKKRSWKLFLALIALLLLVLGLLWQNGILPIGSYIDTYLLEKQGSLKQTNTKISERKPARAEKFAIAPSRPRQETTSPQKEVLSANPEGSLGTPQSREAVPEKASGVPSITSAPTSQSVSAVSQAVEESSDFSADLSDVQTTLYPYSLKIGSFKTLSSMEKAVVPLRQKGLSPYWTQVDLGRKGKWLRLFVGSFDTLLRAREFKESYGLTESRILKTAYAVQLGESLRSKIGLIEKNGFSPYVIKDFSGKTTAELQAHSPDLPVDSSKSVSKNIRLPEVFQKGSRIFVGAFLTKRAADAVAHHLKESGIDCQAVLR